MFQNLLKMIMNVIKKERRLEQKEGAAKLL